MCCVHMRNVHNLLLLVGVLYRCLSGIVCWSHSSILLCSYQSSAFCSIHYWKRGFTVTNYYCGLFLPSILFLFPVFWGSVIRHIYTDNFCLPDRLTLLSFKKISVFFLVTTIVLKSRLSDINTATPALYCLLFMQYIFFHAR